MDIRVSTHSRTTYSATIDGVEVELTHQPADTYGDSIFAKRVGDKLVVAYLVQDADGSGNPMTENDCEGVLYTRDERVITDDASEVRAALGIDGNDEVDIDRWFPCEPYIDWKGIQQKTHCLRDIAAKQWLEKIAQDVDLMERAITANTAMGRVLGATWEQAFAELRNEIWRDLEDSNGEFSEEVETLALELYSVHWRDIAGPYVVPVSYHSERGSTDISLADWDGDADDLPNGVWVADKGAIENITPLPAGIEFKHVEGNVMGVFPVGETVALMTGKYETCRQYMKDTFPAPGPAELRVAVDKYAASVLETYAKWCDGDVWGCVTEIFGKVSTAGEGEDEVEIEWELLEEDACRNFIGQDYALETLKSEYFESVIERLKVELNKGE